MKEFSEFISDKGLMDIPLAGGSFMKGPKSNPTTYKHNKTLIYKTHPTKINKIKANHKDNHN
jgi:hypothetical protein